MTSRPAKFLVIFDVDSTLIQDEVIELLADVAGKRSEVAEVTARAMAGELDFAESLISRVAQLQGLPQSVFNDTLDRIKLTDGAQELIQEIHRRGGVVAAVSGGFTQLLEPLAEVLGLDYHRANTLEVADGHLTGRVSGQIVDRKVKAECLAEWAKEAGVPLNRTIAVGDGANDLEMIAQAGLGVAFNAKPVVRASAQLSLFGKSLAPLNLVLPNL